jgi:DNA-directed RNA polymerase specialized sigma24 family protein
MNANSSRYDRLVASYYPAVFQLAVKFSRSPAEAVTLTRHAFERAARQLPRFRSADEVNFLLLTSLTTASAPKAA